MNTMRSHQIRRGVLWVVVLLFVLPFATASAAASEEWEFSGWQDGLWDTTMLMGGAPPVTARDLKMYGEVLGLDEMQMEIMQDAYTEFETAYHREWTLFSEKRSDEQHAHRPDGDWSDMQKRMMEVKAEFDKTVDRLEERFIADLRLVLSAEQLDRWSLLEREQRRAKTLAKYASYSDEKVDLVACVQALELSAGERAALEPVLEEYRTQMDAALAARNRKAEAVGVEYAKTQEMQMDLQKETDPMVIQERWQEFSRRQEEIVPMGLELRKLCGRVRDVNVQFRKRLSQEVPSHQLAQFEKIATAKKSNGFVFGGSSRAHMMFKMLENLDTMVAGAQMQMEAFGGDDLEAMGSYMRRIQRVQPLSDAQLAEVERIRAEFEDRQASIRSRYSKGSADQNEPGFIQLPTPQGTLMLRRITEGGEGDIMFTGFGMGSGSDDPEMQREMSELDQRTIDRLRAILTIEQRGLMAMF
ncbi:MAG: hypothetical protein ACIAQF_04045 [Phycisphaerales bacterium JB065]